MSKPLSVISVSTVLPRPCGIATFNQDVTWVLEENDVIVHHVAMERAGYKYAYPTPTIAIIRQEVRSDYGETAAIINHRQPDAVLLQHEFGIFGGWQGEFIVDLLRNLTVPIVVVLHRYEFVQDSDAKRKRVEIVREIARYSKALIVISDITRRKIADDLREAGISTPVIHIPHGTPDVADYFLENPKRKVLGGDDILTLATFGLISERKGIQDVVEVLPQIVNQFPTVLYRVLGRPHPTDSRAQAFLRTVKQRVKELNVSKNVSFVTRFLSVRDIMENLQATDIYITFYDDPYQASSGTLAFSLAAGCCVVSTPYIHARELLADGRGVLVQFRDRQTLASALVRLLTNEQERNEYRRNALAYGRQTAWSLIGKRYVTVLKAAVKDTVNGVSHH